MSAEKCIVDLTTILGQFRPKPQIQVAHVPDEQSTRARDALFVVRVVGDGYPVMVESLGGRWKCGNKQSLDSVVSDLMLNKKMQDRLFDHPVVQVHMPKLLISSSESLSSLTLSKYLDKQAAVKPPVVKPPGFDAALDRFLELAQEMLDKHTAENDKELERLHPGKEWKTPRTILTAEHGQRYVRIVKSAPGQRSVYCFIDSTNGDVLKGASWKKPAPGVRGSIFAPNPIAGVGAYGARYFR